MTLASPPAGFATRPLDLVQVDAGTRWRRIYASRFPDPLGSGPGLSRFSDPTGTRYPLIYLGETLKVAFVETLLRDRADGRDPDFVMGLGELAVWNCALI